jgi:hypothetical protein
MNKILIQNLNDKFINNIALCNSTDGDKIIVDTRGSLYKLYYQYQFTHVIFVDSLINQESIQFIQEFGQQITVYIYKNSQTTNYENIQNIRGVLSYTKLNNTHHRVITIPTLVNHDLYYKNETLNKKDQIVSFIEHITTIPEPLQDYLYPKTKLAIKLFNNPEIIHPQNLGLLSERDKAILLQNSKYYLAITEDYVAEAWACGCSVLLVDELHNCEPKQYKYAKSFQSYANFLKGLTSAKK